MSKWEEVKLGTLISEHSERNKLLAYTDVYSVTNSAGFVSSTDYFSKEVFSKDISTYKTVHRGMFAYNPSRINVGSVSWLNCRDTVVVSPLYVVFKVDDKKIYQQFLNYFLHGRWGNLQIRSLTTGSVRDSLKFNALKEIIIPLPPIAIQKQIATILDSVTELITLRKQRLVELDNLIKSVFYDMFGDPVTNPMKWEGGTIRDVVMEVKYGTSKPANEGGKYPYLRMNNITYDGQLNLSDMKYIDVADSEVEKYTVYNGDVLFNRTNSKELVGKTCVFNSSTPMIIAGYIIRVRLNERAVPIYLSSVLNSEYGKVTLRSMCKAIIGQANINAQELQNIKILIPPIEIQRHFTGLVNTIDKIKLDVKKSIEESQLLFDCLMSQYFE